ncbi:hypothetical protein QR680_006857 [Steinernema hermaphroditum]|uniref:Malate synthase n=1 Tax=Steinernema hermaphroditum TaxID=289476 RepID=A0AA39HXZ3_9BILA|nr:hypothetical protein QR680_006857 [Steinernema hermaphroditum]
MQQVKAGLKAIYLSGWQVAGDANLAGEMYPDQSLYPANSVPQVVRRINNSLTPPRPGYIDYFAPIVADAEAGFGGVLNAFELMKGMIEAGASGVHFEDQLASVKKCGHMGGKKLVAARLAADVMGTPTVLLARTDADAADLLTSDVDDNDRPFITGERTVEGFFRTRAGIDQAIIARPGLCALCRPDLFAEAIHRQFPGKLLAYNCSPSFNWKKNLDDATIAKFQRELGAMGYKKKQKKRTFPPPPPSKKKKESLLYPPHTTRGQTPPPPDAQRFLRELHVRFEGRRQKLLQNRKSLQAKIDAGTYFPDFNPDSAAIREGVWHGASIPDDLKDRRVEITGPTDRKMVINALNSGARVFMADFEDSNSPTWRNQLEGQTNLFDAVRDQISYVHPITKKEYSLNKDHAVLKVRPRGWHLPEKHVLVDGQPMSGSLFDFGLFFFHNARALLDKGSGPYFYFPKLENGEEAQLWADVIKFAEDYVKVPHGSAKCTVLIEHVLASFQMNAIIHALKDNIVGLNCGRWDYIFSYIKTFRNHRKFLLPDRFQIGMTTPFLRAYALQTIKTCHARNIFAMGGMAAQIPIKHDLVANEKAFAMVRADKEREVADGHDGTWVAHPGLVPVAMDIFNRTLSGPNQIEKQLAGFSASSADLTAIPEGTRTDVGFRHNISVTLGYLDHWLRGVGCVPLYNLMEDAATAEISRAQLWQWLRHEAKLEDGTVIDVPLVKQTIASETERRLIRAGSVVSRLPEAAELLEKFVTEDEMSDFLTLDAYDRLVSEGK